MTGYRERSLADELDGARHALSAASIDATVRTNGAPVSRQTDSVLAWVVREGVTNVIRHSRARRCTIEVRRGADTAVVEVSDDGVGQVPGTAGTGLRGLAERVQAAGGSLEVKPGRRSGFRLIASVPARGEP